MNQSHEDIDLIDLSLQLWQGKWILIIFMGIALLIGGAYLFYTKDEIVIKAPLYESKIFFSIESIPTNKLESNYFNYSEDVVIKDFQDLFYSKGIFQNWKNENKNSKLNFSNLSYSKKIDGSIVAKNEQIFLKYPKNERFLTIRSNQIEIFEEIFQYTNYVSKSLTFKYISSFKKRYKLIDLKFKEFNRTYPDAASSEFIYELMKIDSFLDGLNKDTKFVNVLHLESPTNLNAAKPKQKFPYLRLIVFAIFGGMFGAVYIFTQNALKKRN